MFSVVNTLGLFSPACSIGGNGEGAGVSLLIMQRWSWFLNVFANMIDIATQKQRHAGAAAPHAGTRVPCSSPCSG